MYGILIAFSSIVCLLVIEKILQKNKLIPINDYWNLVSILIPVSLLGARLYFVLDNWGYFYNHKLDILNFKAGGLGIYGALAAGLGTIYIFSKLKKQNPLAYIDLLVVFVPIIQIAGRIGNYFNKELYGLPTNAPWGIFIPLNFRPAEHLEYTKFHPLFLYEIILLSILFSFLVDMYLKNTTEQNTFFSKLLKALKINRSFTKNSSLDFGTGNFLAGYLIGYGVIRIILEPLRIGNAFIIANINLTYLLSVILVVVGLVILIKNLYKKQ